MSLEDASGNLVFNSQADKKAIMDMLIKRGLMNENLSWVGNERFGPQNENSNEIIFLEAQYRGLFEIVPEILKTVASGYFWCYSLEKQKAAVWENGLLKNLEATDLISSQEAQCDKDLFSMSPKKWEEAHSRMSDKWDYWEAKDMAIQDAVMANLSDGANKPFFEGCFPNIIKKYA